MMKKLISEHKTALAVSSLLTLLPMLIGVIIWNRLPDTMAVHWGAQGNADSMGSKALAVFGLPLILLALDWICLLITACDPKNRGQNRKAVGMVIWIMPLASLFAGSTVYSAALGREINVEYLVSALLIIMFIVFGNYLPKIKQNSTIGIKLTWTMCSEENWNKTHRFCGRLWFALGFVLLIARFLPNKIFFAVLFVCIVVMAIAPIIFSYRLYRKQLANGETLPVNAAMPKGYKTMSAIGAGVGIIVLIFCAVLMFTGNIDVSLNDDSFTVNATYYSDITVKYDEIDSVEFRSESDAGTRTYGFGTPRLLMGTFENDEYGTYTRYTYTKPDACIVIRSGERVLVLGGRDDAATQKLYDSLKERV